MTMAASHLEFLVEEPSMEAFLRALLPRLLPQGRTFEVHPFQGKGDLLARLEARLRGYATWLPPDWRLVVVVDRDDDDCHALKQHLEAIAACAGLRTRSSAADAHWQLVNRVAIEELEAWYFGDWDAVRQIYARTPANLPSRQGFRDPDGITGGTWEALERVLQRHGYVPGGLRKIDTARAISAVLEPRRSRSVSFRAFHQAVIEAVP
jgi:hypothetical protein